jgi:hypothetical protein
VKDVGLHRRCDERAVQTLAKVYEDRAEDCTRAAERTIDPVLHKLLLALASKWKQLAAQEKGKSEDTPTSLASDTRRKSKLAR